MKDVSSVIDVEVESLMRKAPASERLGYEDVLRNRQTSRTLPFDDRNEVSADARYIARRIVTNMWIIGVGLPIVAALLIVALK
jgi:hypothetical protein